MARLIGKVFLISLVSVFFYKNRYRFLTAALMLVTVTKCAEGSKWPDFLARFVDLKDLCSTRSTEEQQ